MGSRTNQTDETDIAVLAAMAKAEIASGKAKYISLEVDKEAEFQKILMWIVEHSPKWRSDGSAAIREELRQLGL